MEAFSSVVGSMLISRVSLGTRPTAPGERDSAAQVSSEAAT